MFDYLDDRVRRQVLINQVLINGGGVGYKLRTSLRFGLLH